MTAYEGWVYPLPDLFKQTITSSLDDGLDRWDAYRLIDLADLTPVLGAITHAGTYAHASHALSGHVIPTYADDLFGHIIIVPPRLDLGNLLSNQTRELEVANLGVTARDWEGLVNNAGDGISFDLPSFPVTILPFGSYVIEVSVSTDGPPSIDGTLDFDFDQGDAIAVPVTGTRIVVFEYIPQAGVTETLRFRTDVLEAYDGTEQRISILIAPRQIVRYSVATQDKTDMRLRGLLFDWLPRVFGMPVWFEARQSTDSSLIGTTIIPVDTSYGDFREGGLVMICSLSEGPVRELIAFDVVEIETLDLDQIVTTSELAHSYDAGAYVMPVRTALMQTQTSSQRWAGLKGFEKTTVEFTTLDNEDLSDQTGATIYDGRVVLDDGNVVTDTLPEGFERSVVVIDNSSGRVVQTSRTDRSRIKSRFMWDAPTPAELWRIRQLVHSFHGSQCGFWMVGCRPDFVLAQVIGPGATTFRIEHVNYTAFIGSRRPYGDVSIILKTGQVIRRRITGSEVDNDEEVISVDTPITVNAIQIDAVERIELLMLARIVDDEVTIEHRKPGDATVTIATVSIKE